jgi:hypothetical protein
VLRRIVEAGIIVSLAVYLAMHLKGVPADVESKPIIAALVFSLVELVLVTVDKSRRTRGKRFR